MTDDEKVALGYLPSHLDTLLGDLTIPVTCDICGEKMRLTFDPRHFWSRGTSACVGNPCSHFITHYSGAHVVSCGCWGCEMARRAAVMENKA